MFVINDESKINSHGFRLINAGCDMARFNANPVLLYDHDSKNVIGRCDNVRVEKSRMIFQEVFDEEDPEAKIVKGKVERGFLNGCSPGLIVNKARYVPVGDGEELQVIEWELCEVSITPIPSNAGAVKLYDQKMQELSLDDLVRLAMPTEKNNKQPITNTDMKLTKETMSVLGFEHEPDEKELNAAIMKLHNEKNALQKEIETEKVAKAKEIAELALKNGAIEDSMREEFEKLAIEKPSLALALAGKEKKSERPKKQEVSLAALIHNVPKGAEDRANWTYLDWAKRDPKGLEKLAMEDRQKFEELKENYGK